jgi:hypothetical protein
MARIFIGLSEVAGFYSSLIPYFEKSGHSVTFLSFGKNPYQYQCESSPSSRQLRLWQVCERPISKEKLHPIRFFRFISSLFLKPYLVMPSMLNSDVILLNYCATSFFYLDILILYLLRKRIIYFFHGSDSRPPYMNGKYIYPPQNDWYVLFLTITLRIRLLAIELLASEIVVPPQSSQFFSRRCISFLSIGLPMPSPLVPINSRYPIAPPDSSFQVIHAPSNLINKGTSYIRRAIDTMLSQGIPVEYIELSNRPNSEVLMALAGADLLIDELWSDTRMAGLCMEAASVGTPCLIGSNYTAKQWDYDIGTKEPPVFICQWQELVPCLIQLYNNYKLRSNYHDRLVSGELPSTSQIADRMLSIINNEIPAHFYFAPLSIAYHHGWGAPPADVDRYILHYLTIFGWRALMLPQESECSKAIKLMAAKA